MSVKRQHLIESFVGLVFLILGLWLLIHHLRQYEPQDILNALRATSAMQISGAVGLVCLNLLTISYFDVLTVRSMKLTIPPRKAFLAGFIGAVFSRTLGFSVLTASGVRYRIYRKWGVAKGTLGRFMTLYFGSLGAGFLVVMGLALALQEIPLPGTWERALPPLRWIGICSLALVLTYLAFCGLRHHPLHLFKHRFQLPQAGVALCQISLMTMKWILEAILLFILISVGMPLHFWTFAGFYFAAQVVSIVSHAPGGFGVFDSSLLLLLKNDVPAPQIVSALVLYRVCYNLLPLAVALPLYMRTEVTKKA